MMYKYCRRCGRRLEGEENRLRGYGKTCFEKTKSELNISPLVPLENTPIRRQGNSMLELNIGGVGKEQETHRAEIEKILEQKTTGQGAGKANAEGRAKKNFSEQSKNSKGVNPPHLEETLTPTYKKPLIITPPIPPPPRR